MGYIAVPIYLVALGLIRAPVEVLSQANSKSEHTNALNILDSLLGNYDRRATPTNHLGVATEVECKLYVRSLGSINPDTMDYQADLYLIQHWSDKRLNHAELVDPLDLNDPNLVKAIWKPEVYFPNAKDAEFQYVTVPNVLVRIDPGGQILYMLRLKLKFSCMMELSKFPLDEQICTMEIASFSKTTKELVLRWKEDNPVDISSEVKMPQFEIFKIVPARCQETFHIGNYSCLLAELHLKRSLGFHMVQSYLPTILIVVISWVSFWMDVDSVAGRTTLGVTTLLTVSSKASDVQAEVPLVSYVKAIDIWMGACTGFIFAALLEFTLTNYIWRTGQKYKHRSNYGGKSGGSDVTSAEAEIGRQTMADNGNGGFGPMAAAATAAASGFDPSMFTQMMAAGAVTGNVMIGNSEGFTETLDEQMPLTSSPTSSLLKRRSFQPTRSKESFKYADHMELQQQCENAAQCGQNSPTGIHMQASNGSQFSTVDTEVIGKTAGSRKPANCRVVTFEGSDNNKVLRKSGGGFNRPDGQFYCRLAVHIDEFSRLLFPVAFTVFNIIYWSYYTHWSK